MVRVAWIDNFKQLVVKPVSKEDAAKLPYWVQDTLNTGEIVVCDGIAYALDEQTARNKLE